MAWKARPPGRPEERNDVDYLYRERSLLVRDADIERVMRIVPSEQVEHENNLRGVTLLRFADEETRTMEEVCTAVDQTLGEGVVTPDHVFYICPSGTCPATEPEEVPGDAPPDPGVSTEPATATVSSCPSWTAAGWKARTHSTPGWRA